MNQAARGPSRGMTLHRRGWWPGAASRNAGAAWRRGRGGQVLAGRRASEQGASRFRRSPRRQPRAERPLAVSQPA